MAPRGARLDSQLVGSLRSGDVDYRGGRGPADRCGSRRHGPAGRDRGLRRRDAPPYTSLGCFHCSLLVALQHTGENTPPRVHLDLDTDDVEAEVRRLLALGATRLKQYGDYRQMVEPGRNGVLRNPAAHPRLRCPRHLPGVSRARPPVVGPTPRRRRRAGGTGPRVGGHRSPSHSN
jgi:Glyoxalase-like domain